MKILLTGATGFVGRHLALFLREKGCEVRALARDPKKAEPLKSAGCEIHTGDIRKPETLIDAVKGVDAICHLAALIRARSYREFMETNSIGAKNLVDAALSHGTHIRRFIYVSSISAQGASPSGAPRDEKLPPAPLYDYGKSKLAGEKWIIDAKEKLHVGILRPPIIYSPESAEVRKIAKMASLGFIPILGDGKTRISIIHVHDCVRAIYCLLEKDYPSGTIFPVDDGSVHTLDEFMSAFVPPGKKRVLKLRIPIPIAWLLGLVAEVIARLSNQTPQFTRSRALLARKANFICGHAKLTELTGFKPEIKLRDRYLNRLNTDPVNLSQ
ncbi:MAG: NAD-dependent epimerase/dehydratase family protein [Deltaproteobacteria bacterium]|nr:NAD-dependent epimerase/dehydratase family protein [Deltaproteobacteria bacterium]